MRRFRTRGDFGYQHLLTLFQTENLDTVPLRELEYVYQLMQMRDMNKINERDQRIRNPRRSPPPPLAGPGDDLDTYSTGHESEVDRDEDDAVKWPRDGEETGGRDGAERVHEVTGLPIPQDNLEVEMALNAYINMRKSRRVLRLAVVVLIRLYIFDMFMFPLPLP